MDGRFAFVFRVSVFLLAVTVTSLHNQDHATTHPAYARPMPQNSSCSKNGYQYPELMGDTPHDLVFPRRSGLYLSMRCPPFWYFMIWWQGSTEGNVLMTSTPEYHVDPNMTFEDGVTYSYLRFPEITRSGNFTCCSFNECYCVHQVTFDDRPFAGPSEKNIASSAVSTEPLATIPPSTSPSVSTTKFPVWVDVIIFVISLALFFLVYKVRSGNFSEGILCENSQSLWHTHETQRSSTSIARSHMPQLFTAFLLRLYSSLQHLLNQIFSIW